MSVQDLKALAYDLIKTLQQAQIQLQAVDQEIGGRMQQPATSIGEHAEGGDA